jgi:hypothetical protein
MHLRDSASTIGQNKQQLTDEKLRASLIRPRTFLTFTHASTK